jgi:hypothetical protein
MSKRILFGLSNRATPPGLTRVLSAVLNLTLPTHALSVREEDLDSQSKFPTSPAVRRPNGA